MLEQLDTSTVLLGAAVILFMVALLSSLTSKKYKNLPPGPTGLPLFGHLFLFLNTDKVWMKLVELGQKYGKVLKIRLGVYDAFVLNGYDVIKEAMVDKADSFSERPRWLKSVTDTQREKAGIFFNAGWRERRRFTLISMRDFGLGKHSLDDKMIEEAHYLNEEFAKADEKPLDPSTILPFTTSNIICSIINGHRFLYGDTEFLHLNNCFNELTKTSGGMSVGNFVPILRFITTKKEKEKMSYFDPILETCQRWTKEHADSFDEDNIRDLIDLFLAENKKDSKNQIEEMDLAMLIFELFLAGTETTSTTLNWGLLHLIHNQEMQDRCREEIREEIGLDRPPVFADSKNTPYINAVIYETQRTSNIVPLSVLHCAAADTELSGYTIPAGSIVMMNMYTALRDPKYWVDPDRFNPDRWLDDDGNIKKNCAFIPFSTGKRVCLGEQLAKKELYIFLTSMLQKFRFEMVDENNPPSLEGVGNAVHRPQNYELKAVKL